jgi:hypothetical protein
MKNLITKTNEFIKNSPIQQNKEAVAQNILFANLSLANILEYKKEFKKTKREVIYLLEYGKNINYYTEGVK